MILEIFSNIMESTVLKYWYVLHRELVCCTKELLQGEAEESSLLLSSSSVRPLGAVQVFSRTPEGAGLFLLQSRFTESQTALSWKGLTRIIKLQALHRTAPKIPPRA